ncbi:MAG: hypothetical protein JNL70_23675 [Saprospiraceae bacterium]|nr:hypothetical protein [Saprospiraceae bacterium]
MFYSLLANLLSKPRPSGDYGVGYAYAYLVCGAGFIISSGLLAWNMNVNHCFDWVLHYRNVLVFIGWIAFVTMTFWALEYHRVFILLHVLVFASCFYALNAQHNEGFLHSWAKLSMQIGFAASLLIAVGIWGAWSKIRVMHAIHKIQSKIASLSYRKAEYQATLDKIINYNDTSINGLLKFAEPKMDKQLRENAIAKIKTYANKEEQMIAILTQKNLATIWAYDDDSYYVYAYLDGNRVENPEKFIEPIKYSLKVFAIRAEHDMDDPYKREIWSLNLQSFCRALDFQFKEYAKEFRPGMLKLQTVLAAEYPQRMSKDHRKWYDKTIKAYRIAVKKWLDANL